MLSKYVAPAEDRMHGLISPWLPLWIGCLDATIRDIDVMWAKGLLNCFQKNKIGLRPGVVFLLGCTPRISRRGVAAQDLNTITMGGISVQKFIE